MSRFLKITILNLILLCGNCFAAEVSILNNLEKQEEGTKLEVDNIHAYGIPKSKFKLTLYPGELKPLAAGSVTHFTVSRIFPTHKLKYDVECIPNEVKVEITLSKIHENKMGEECKLMRFGHWSKRSGLKWNELSK